MKRQLLIGFLFILSLSTMAQNTTNTYQSEWKQVEQDESNDLPQSALQSVDKILKQAINDKNGQQTIKALIHKNKYKVAIDNSESEGLIQDLENLVATNNIVIEQSLLYSMIAELYYSYYSSNSWKIRGRTALANTIPDNMEEWSSNIFFDKIRENLDLSVKNKQDLTKSQTTQLADIIILGEGAEELSPTLYDFLMDRAINISKEVSSTNRRTSDINTSTGLSIDQLVLPANQFANLKIKNADSSKNSVFSYYQQYQTYLLTNKLDATLAISELDRIIFVSTMASSLNDEKQIGALRTLLDTHSSDDAKIYITAQLVNKLNSYNKNEGIKEAHSLCENGIKKWANSKNIYILQDLLSEIERPQLKMEGHNLYYPNEAIEIKLYHQNLQSLAPKGSLVLFKIGEAGDDEQYINIKDFAPELVSHTTFASDTLKLDIGKWGAGKYKLAYIANMLTFDSMSNKLTKAEEENNVLPFTISALSSFNRNKAKNEYEIFVVDRRTGQPIPNATVQISQKTKGDGNESKEILTNLKTDKLGLATFVDKLTQDSKSFQYHERGRYKIMLGSDSYQSGLAIYSGNYNYASSDKVADVPPTTFSVFVDRSIYRPGQIVYYKAIAINNDGKLVTNHKTTAKLYNSQNEVIKEESLTTNEFGSIAGNFSLPTSGLAGGYYIDVEGMQTYFAVEEYKRPTFELSFDKVKGSYTFGEEVTVTGNVKNYSGISLQDTEVTYSINRRNAFPFSYPRSYDEPTHFDNGTISTDANGRFSITFTPQATDNSNSFGRGRNNVFAFDINATATDINGESQSGNYSVIVGNVSMLINIDMPNQIEKTDTAKIQIKTSNLEDEEIKAKGTYTIYSLNDKDLIENKVLTGSFDTGEQIALGKELRKLSSGKYQLEIKALDDKKNEVENKKDFVLYAFDDKKPPVKTNAWLVEKNTIWSKDKPAEVIFGSSEKDSYVLYEVYNNTKIFERRFIKFNANNETFKLPYKDMYGDKVYMSFTLVKDGQFVNKNILVVKKEEKIDTNLNVKLSVFRDKLRSGQEETWTISVQDSKNKASAAEVLASMYDRSLDMLNSYSPWVLNRPYNNKNDMYTIDYNFAFNYGYNYAISISLNTDPKQVDRKYIVGDVVNWFGYSINSHITPFGILMGFAGGQEQSLGVTRSNRQSKSTSLAGSISIDNNAVIEQESKTMDDMAEGETINQESPSPAPQIRSNFNETAFFFPQLQTNAQGETLVSFTAPESNTSWRFRILAHDKETKEGTAERMVVTSKELMVTPNLPRFVRQGDKTTISTKISNLSENSIDGNVYIEFFNPTTAQIIDLGIAKQKQTFAIAKGQSTSASWTFDVPSNIDMIGCRIVAQNQSFSDGEQHTLAVLPNRMLVTESLPFDVTKSGESTFIFDKMLNNKSASITNYKLTLEYASNPAWYAVMALPTMSNPSSENAVDWFASYYVNTLGASIAKQYPKVMAMINAWKKQGESKESLASKLEQNEELKSVLLEETPWVLEAKNETEQMQRLSLLFDVNNTKELTSKAIDKLNKLQSPDGGWMWHIGLRNNRSITQYILHGLSNLQLVGQVEYPSEVKEMQMRALNYLDKAILEDFNSLKKHNKDWAKTASISSSQLEYLYVRSMYRDIPISHESREAERFYTTIVTKYWTKLSLYEKSLLAILAKQNGDNDLAGKLVKSIREYAKVDPKMGMYWPNNKSNAFLSMSAISTHYFLMDALKENGASDKEMNQMKQWLVKQKQTQVWETTQATIYAIGTLLSTGSNWYDGQTSESIIKVGSKEVDSQNSQLGTAYVKTSWTSSQISKDMGKVSVTSKATTPSYGALHWQYYEDLGKISAQAGELSIKKELYKKELTNNGKTLVVITTSNPISVGDEVVVRLIVQASNSMEFVHLKDMRAACFEPLQVLSGTAWNNQLTYYQTTKDASTNFYIDHLPKGTYVIEYSVYATRSGEYANGITSIQCLYAPQFVSHTSGITVNVKE